MKEMRVIKKAGLLGKDNKDWRNVTEHLMVVSSLAGFLAEKLKTAGQDIDPELVESAAILHDVSKRIDIERDVRYDTEKKEGRLTILLEQAGYSEQFIQTASYAGRVPEISIEDNEARSKAIDEIPLEQLIIAYSDARVRNVNVVSLEEARDKNKAKVPKDQKFYDKWHRYYKEVEEYLFEKTDGKLKLDNIDNEECSNYLRSIERP